MSERHRNRISDSELRTSRQWLDMGYIVNDKAEGIMLYPNYFHKGMYRYYNKNEVHKATAAELQKAKVPILEKRRKYARKYRERLRKEKEREYGIKDFCKQYRKNNKRIQKKYDKLSDMIVDMARDYAPNKTDNPSRVICFDVETTGLKFDNDEVLQLSIIDGDYNVLFNSYIKPYYKKEWKSAEEINGISKDMVADAPYPHEIVNTIQEIVSSADTYVSYNGRFDIEFLENWGIVFGNQEKGKKYYDVMLEFAPIYGEYNERYGTCKWQKLGVCAAFFGYEFKAHDSLEDVKATLFCYNKMLELQK